MARVLLLRHGETEWSRTGRHTGLTDIELTPAGESEARRGARLLTGLKPVLVLSSPLRRARRTAELVGLAALGPVETDADLVEWDYGKAEGRTAVEIRADYPGWSIWADGAPGGESPAEVGARLDRVLARIRPLILTPATTADGEVEHLEDLEPLVVIVGHGHALRVLTARWLGLEPGAGALFRLDTAALGVLGFEHDRPVLRAWNVAAT
jgi:broad specificity phosphatase PhoE